MKTIVITCIVGILLFIAGYATGVKDTMTSSTTFWQNGDSLVKYRLKAMDYFTKWEYSNNNLLYRDSFFTCTGAADAYQGINDILTKKNKQP